MKARLVILFWAAMFTAPLAAAQDTADAAPEWQVCNETSFILRTAIAAREDDGLTSRGWMRFRPGECKVVSAPEGRTRYLYAESSDAHHGGIREWKGGIQLCVGNDDFVARNDMGCALQDFVTRNFMEIDAREPVTRLVEPDNYGSRAQTAGIQRLLRDAGYNISRIDGVSGRRTVRTLNEFLKDKNLQTTPAIDVTAQIDALETAAQELIGSVGLLVCNQSSHTVWVALGQKHRTTWKSEGWWRVEASSCPQILTDSLIKKDVHLFARQERTPSEGAETPTDRILTTETATSAQFCISDARFSSLGRDNCDDNGYVAVSFRALPNDQKGVTINLTDTDFSESALAGLRR